MSEMSNAQRAIKLREIELEIIALEAGRPWDSPRRKAFARSQIRVSAHRARPAVRKRPAYDWELAWENFDSIVGISTRRNAERYKAIGDAEAFIALERIYQSLGDDVKAGRYADRAWAIATSIGYSAYSDIAEAESFNVFKDEKLRVWFGFGWKENADRCVAVKNA